MFNIISYGLSVIWKKYFSDIWSIRRHIKLHLFYLVIVYVKKSLARNILKKEYCMCVLTKRYEGQRKGVPFQGWKLSTLISSKFNKPNKSCKHSFSIWLRRNFVVSMLELHQNTVGDMARPSFSRNIVWWYAHQCIHKFYHYINCHYYRSKPAILWITFFLNFQKC